MWVEIAFFAIPAVFVLGVILVAACKIMAQPKQQCRVLVWIGERATVAFEDGMIETLSFYADVHILQEFFPPGSIMLVRRVESFSTTCRVFLPGTPTANNWHPRTEMR